MNNTGKFADFVYSNLEKPEGNIAHKKHKQNRKSKICQENRKSLAKGRYSSAARCDPLQRIFLGCYEHATNSQLIFLQNLHRRGLSKANSPQPTDLWTKIVSLSSTQQQPLERHQRRWQWTLRSCGPPRHRTLTCHRCVSEFTGLASDSSLAVTAGG